MRISLTRNPIASIAAISLASFGMFAASAPFGLTAESDSKAKGKKVPSYVTAQFEKPRERTVHVQKAMVRSGPSDQYYPTNSLVKGSSVEVYLETSDGWSGIRPPATCHDWIPANVAYLLPGGKTAEIIEDDTPAWIGSEQTDVPKFQWQTSLSKTQQVQVLGEESQMTEDGKRQLWYKIAPPQGEFRWIKTSQLSDEMPAPELMLNTALVATQDGSRRSASKENPDSNSVSKTKKSPNPASKVASDSSQKSSTSSPKNDKNVRLANHSEPVESDDGSNTTGGAPGKLVWSDEQEVLAQVQRQIQNEQSEVKRQMAADGIPMQVAENVGTEPQPMTRTKIRPIPMTARTSKSNADHQTDSFRQWDAMQSSAPSNPSKPRVGPLGSVLGLIGIGVIEAERAPVNAEIAKQYHSRPQGNLANVGPVGTSRLDRLPRPGHSSGMMLPPGGTAMGSSTFEMASATNPPRTESTFSKWMASREPIFGGSNSTMPAAPLPTTPLPPAAYATASPLISSLQPSHAVALNDPAAWHGLRSNASSSSVESGATIPLDRPGSADDVDSFQTPEIQSALVELTNEVARPTERWNLTALRNQASRWVEEGPTAMVRGEARLLMDRIDRFESLRQRTLGMAANGAMLAQNTMQPPMQPNVNMGVVPASAISPAAPTEMTISNGVATTTGQAGDASGWLVQVHTSYPGQPEFALTDDGGNVIVYVQSTAGLNLRRYLQQPVKVYGLRGYVPNLAAKQIIAERVVRVR